MQVVEAPDEVVIVPRLSFPVTVPAPPPQDTVGTVPPVILNKLPAVSHSDFAIPVVILNPPVPLTDCGAPTGVGPGVGVSVGVDVGTGVWVGVCVGTGVWVGEVTGVGVGDGVGVGVAPVPA